MQLQIEEQALSKETDAQSKTRMEKIKEELQKLKTDNDALTKQWDAEKAAIAKVREVKKEIDAVKKEMEQAERVYDLNKLAELKYGRLPSLQKQLDALEKVETGMLTILCAWALAAVMYTRVRKQGKYL